jgi:hypothetical protein
MNNAVLAALPIEYDLHQQCSPICDVSLKNMESVIETAATILARGLRAFATIGSMS